MSFHALQRAIRPIVVASSVCSVVLTCLAVCASFSDIHYLNFSAGDPIQVFHMDDDW